jgi:hypothetical protein
MKRELRTIGGLLHSRQTGKESGAIERVAATTIELITPASRR